MSFYKNAGGMVCPTTRLELMEEIGIRIDRGQTNLNDIDTSKITDMSDLFYEFSQNVDVSLWDVSNVTNMRYMFHGCTDFNCDLSRWDVSKVEDMENMFAYCQHFNSDLSRWNVSNVIDMEYMFYGCEEFNCYTLSNWKPKSIRAREDH